MNSVDGLNILVPSTKDSKLTVCGSLVAWARSSSPRRKVSWVRHTTKRDAVITTSADASCSNHGRVKFFAHSREKPFSLRRARHNLVIDSVFVSLLTTGSTDQREPQTRRDTLLGRKLSLNCLFAGRNNN